ncbi:MAG: HAMP domain-containing histidine kinase [Acholeplasmatales bacterium]|nr:HAMP domain-containing histidine kinase [Acholeplasmatales bacterium]
MKKLSISGQLITIFVFIMLIASSLFAVVTFSTVYGVAENEVYSRLSTYSYILNDDFGPQNRDEKPKSFPDMNIGYLIYKNGNIFQVSTDLYTKYIAEEELVSLINEVKETRNESNNGLRDFRAQGSVTTKYGKVYYVCQVRDDFNNYTIMFTDTVYTRGLISNVSLRLMLLFLGIVLITIVILYIWNYRFAKRIHNLQDHILNLPKNKYEEKYVDDSLDEIGELSRSVERMRIEIDKNEHTKQDMLQNLSHDFKTPIAVIKSYAEAIQDGVESPEQLSVIIEQADILKNKVNRLLQYNSLEYLEKNGEFEDVNMNDIINEVVLSYKYQTKLEFILDLDENINFKGYRENWTTVVSNIIDNAKRYANSKIEIILRENRLRIYNDGEHIDEQFINNVFKPYEKGSKGQFGLGMSIVQKTVNFFNMNLSVRNEEPVGVSFIIEN